MSRLAERIAELPGIALDELDASAALMTRVDRKYLVPHDALAELIAEQLTEMRVLQIDDARSFRYHTVYFDTEDFLFFRQHVQRRRHRFKVRTRTYCDSGGSYLEVKSKGLRGATVKQRIRHDPQNSARLSPSDEEFLARRIGHQTRDLRAVLATDYRRTTLVGDATRITIDVDLQARGSGRRAQGPAEALVEVKSAQSVIDADRHLRHRGIRPHSVSKYCASAAVLYPHLPGNDWQRMLRRHWSDAREEPSAGVSDWPPAGGAPPR